MSVNSKMTAIADLIRALLGLSGTLGLDAMATNLGTEQTNISNAFSAVNSKGGTVPSSKVSGNLATAINSIPTGVTVQRKTGTFTTSGSSFAVDVGFRPDLVLLHAGEDDGGDNKMHTAAAFYEDTRDIVAVQAQLASNNGFYMFYILPTDYGFSGNAWKVDNNWSWNEFSTQISYVAVKYT